MVKGMGGECRKLSGGPGATREQAEGQRRGGVPEEPAWKGIAAAGQEEGGVDGGVGDGAEEDESNGGVAAAPGGGDGEEGEREEEDPPGAPVVPRADSAAVGRGG